MLEVTPSLEVRQVAAAGSASVTEISFRVPAGFPSPAEDLGVKRIDLNEVLIRHPDATFFVWVRGDSMSLAGICDGDRLVVDRALTPEHGQVVVAILDGELTVKRLYRKNGIVKLQAANPTYPDIRMREASELVIWGVVTHCIKSLL
ncbi:LexA family protein [Cupriavidus sp. TMH.W2]|uniref:LexA family protein n=1 Tax=Cupriavidus sp. TMH.W2 TaxID=3434465 RepID=UPI003D77C295